MVLSLKLLDQMRGFWASDMLDAEVDEANDGQTVGIGKKVNERVALLYHRFSAEGVFGTTRTAPSAFHKHSFRTIALLVHDHYFPSNLYLSSSLPIPEEQTLERSSRRIKKNQPTIARLVVRAAFYVATAIHHIATLRLSEDILEHRYQRAQFLTEHQSLSHPKSTRKTPIRSHPLTTEYE